MKILQIFGAVVAVHLIVFVFIFASPGCQSGPRNIPTPDATLPAGGPAVEPVTYSPALASPQPVDLGTSGGSVVTYAPASPSGQARPTRPGSPAAAAVIPVKPMADVAPVTTYTGGKGDSLWSIAKKNNLTVSELAKTNNLSTGAALQPGKKLIIPGKVTATSAPKDLAAAAPAGKAADKPATAAATPAKAGAEAMNYTVLPGETLSMIARKFGMKTQELAAANNITDPSKVRAGQQLVIPGFTAVAGKKGSRHRGRKSTSAKTSTDCAADNRRRPAAADVPPIILKIAAPRRRGTEPGLIPADEGVRAPMCRPSRWKRPRPIPRRRTKPPPW